MKRYALQLRERPEAVVELLDNAHLVRQVLANRVWRRVYASLDDAEHVHPGVLFISVKVDGVECLVDSRAIIIRHYFPKTPAERSAVHEAAAAVMSLNRYGFIGQRRLDYVEERIWLALTGNLISYEKEVKKPSNVYLSFGTAIEPSIGDGTSASYQDL